MNKIKLTLQEEGVLRLLYDRRGHVVSQKFVSASTGYNARSLRKIVERLGLKGFPIGSIKTGEERGYRYPLDEFQKLEGIKDNRVQAYSMLNRVHAIESTDLELAKEKVLEALGN